MTTPAQALFDFAEKSNIVYLKDRWQDEKEYEDFADYKKQAKEIFAKGGYTLQSMTQSFTITLTKDDLEFELKIGMTKMSLKTRKTIPQVKKSAPKLVIVMFPEAKKANLSVECVDLNAARKKLEEWIMTHQYGNSHVKTLQYDGKELSWNGRFYDGKQVDVNGDAWNNTVKRMVEDVKKEAAKNGKKVFGSSVVKEKEGFKLVRTAAPTLTADADGKVTAKEEKPKSIGEYARRCIKEGMTNEQVVDAVKVYFPNANTTSSSVAWYRSQMKKSA